jgi:hypothetical protein
MPINISTSIEHEIQNSVTDPTINSEWIKEARISIEDLDPISGRLIVKTDPDINNNRSHIEFTEESPVGEKIAKIVSVINSEFVRIESIKDNLDKMTIERGERTRITVDFSMGEFEEYFSQLFSKYFRVDPTFELLKYDYGFGSVSTKLEFKTENRQVYPELQQKPLPLTDSYTLYNYTPPWTIEHITKKIQSQIYNTIQIKDSTVEIQPSTCVVCPEENSLLWIHIFIPESELDDRLPNHLVN